jgi:hypothetical protein
MRLEDFRVLVERLKQEIPAEFERGVADVEVSPKAVPDPVYAGVYTLGECVPLTWTGDGADLHSKIVLFYGSFAALASREPGYDWRTEAWDTLTHELRHHLEFRAHTTVLEAYDWAAEQNFARHEGRAFDPVFYRSGEKVTDRVYKVDDDVFLESDGAEFTWHGERYRADAGADQPPAFLTLRGLAAEPHGDAVLVLTRRPALRDLWRRPVITQRTVSVQALDG